MLENIERELKDAHYPFGVNVSISIDNPNAKYPTPCEWYYAERENIDIIDWAPDACVKGSSTFTGEPAYIHERDSDGTQGGLYASRNYNIVFFHNGRPWEIRYSGLPSNPTEKWKSHPYYKYLEESIPVTEAIIKSFRFTD